MLSARVRGSAACMEPARSKPQHCPRRVGAAGRDLSPEATAASAHDPRGYLLPHGCIPAAAVLGGAQA